MWKSVIHNKWMRCKRKAADVLQKKSERLSERGKKAVLFFFCMLFAGCSIAIVIHAFTDNAKTVTIKGKMPRIVRDKEAPAMPFLSKAEYERIEKFKAYIYQLPKPLFDSFMQARPKLLDSIIEIEQYYQSQNKK